MRRALAAIALAACGGDPAWPVDPGGAAVSLTAMTYNVAVAAGAELDAVADVVAVAAPDVVLAQEVGDGDATATALGLALARPPLAGVTVLYDEARLALRASEAVVLGEDDDGWGVRPVVIAALEERSSGRVVGVYSAHFCVTLRTPDDRCDVARQVDYAETIVAELSARGGGPAIVGGDLNVSEGEAASPVIARLGEADLFDAYVAGGGGEGDETFPGNAFVPPGRIDFVLATAPADASEASVRRQAPAAEASDHFAVVVTLAFPATE